MYIRTVLFEVVQFFEIEVIGNMKKRIQMSKIIPIVLASIIIVFTIYVSNRIYHASFEQYIYNLLKSTGTSSSFLSYSIFYAIIGVIVLCPLFLLPTIDFGKVISINLKRKNKKVQLFPIKNIKKYSTIILILAILYLGYGVGFFEYLNNSLKDTNLFKKYYVDASSTSIEFPDEKKNLIYIFLESTEISNMSKENGGVFDTSTIPNLERVALENLNFSNCSLLGGAQESYGTGWTASAMIAQTAGIPLKMKASDISSDSTSFTNIITLGDILSDNGYDNYLFMGSDSNFGGRDAYFRNHNYFINDYKSAIENGKIPSDYHEWWGYEDSKLFTYAKEMLTEISKNDKPFNFTMLTADTHFTDGYLDKSCNEVFDNNYANSFYCSEDTVIIISGDHLTMQENFYKDIDDNYVRTVYNAFINVLGNDINNKNRVFTTMDMFPTTLGALGASIDGDRLGLGTNLFSDRKTIPEEIGLDNFNDELKKNSSYYYNYIRG